MGRVVDRAERGIAVARERPLDRDFYLDPVALSLHDFYTGLERAFHRIAVTVEATVPAGQEWRQELLRQMAAEYPEIRPAVLSAATVLALEQGLGTAFQRVRRELAAFADFLDRLSQAGK